MANIQETISEVEKLNPELARQIRKYVKEHSYGLVFENNLPEAVRLYKKKVCPGDVVNILPPRGQFETKENSLAWVVKAVKDGMATLQRDGEMKDVPVEDTVVTVSFRDVIYPGLKEIDRIERGNPDTPYHMVINAENYHALEALTYAYSGRVDCIYIDPPYNKPSSRDWKYNCNYVDTDDKYRHSKWLTFIERRLKLAKDLLNPNESVLIVTIDETEYARLSLLLEKLFPEAKIQMITTRINKKGSTRSGQFARCEEYIFFVQIGSMGIMRQKYSMLDVSDNSNPDAKEPKNDTVWNSLLRRGSEGSSRRESPNLFYPIWINKKEKRIIEVGCPLPLDMDRHLIEDNPPQKNVQAVWPVRTDNSEGRWQLSCDTLREYLTLGIAKLGSYNKKRDQWAVLYLKKAQREQLESGTLVSKGKDADGSLILAWGDSAILDREPKTIWIRDCHDASTYGTNLIAKFIPNRTFSFPKSLYAVQDTLRFFLANKPEALIIDFFAGSGTTLHAVNLLNAEDNGKRRCICVTNNEVSVAEEKKFVEAGLRPSDADWEKYGIANYITWPRTKCAIEGVNIKGEPLTGCYIGSNTPMANGFKANAIFCELTYESAWPIRLDNAFDAIAPILWMQAGCQGSIIRRISKSYQTTPYYGVLFRFDQASKFCEKVKNTPSIKTVFVVTDDQRRYSNICRRLPGIEVHRLYETYLRTFEICGEGGLD